MLKIGLDKKSKMPIAVMVIEPRNIELLKQGKPIRVKLSEFIGADIQKDYGLVISYTPDIEFVIDCIQQSKETATWDTVAKIIDASKDMAEVTRT